MASNGTPVDYTVRSRFAETGLRCPPAVAERVESLLTPYLSLTEGRVADGEWQVVSGEEPPAGATPESVRMPGEDAVGYAVDHAKRTLHHLAPWDEAWATQALLRATRSAHRCAASRRGVVFLHAGLVDLDGMGVLLVGGSCSGKTSFITASGLSGAGVMVSNDDVGLVSAPETGGLVGHGWPRSISMRLDTMRLLFGAERSDAIRAGLTHPANRTLLSLKESGVEEHGTALLYPWEYTEVVGTGIRRSATVDAVVYLSLCDDSGGGFEVVPPGERDAAFAAHQLDAPNKNLNLFGYARDPEVVDATRAMATRLPTYRFRYPFSNAYKEVGRLTTCLRQAG
ncbi:hypothetical protein [Umezawaea tangerina]|uniref:HprK-related kinase B n=1 Tax=Umezawaea tangerina TaxID=84725 RepID=A0A2T0SVS2_9PSEU|nr:hypothetical protein [Umezawaea tangerina]PRY37512.1 hypothetical protein CLV43_110324 [Umezawaea tangerina]